MNTYSTMPTEFKMKKLILVLVISMLSKESHLSANACLQCQDVNRWNTNCVDKYEDCGHCYDRFVNDPTQPFKCIEIAIVEKPPEHKRAAEGDEIVLECRFNVDIFCHWTLNGTEVSTAAQSGYRYEVEVKSKDCSLTISSVKAKDYGRWQCSNKATDETTGSVYSTITQLLPFEKVVVHPDKLINVDQGENVILHASFDQPVECIWYKQHHEKFTKVRMDEKRHFLTDGCVQRDNCSFVIKNISDTDVGDYQCEATATDYRDVIRTGTARVNVHHKSPIILVHPTNKTVAVLYEKMELNCEFSSEVVCGWLLNGTVMDVDGQRIGFRNCNGGWTKDCTIIIYDFEPEFVGWWKCVNKDNEAIASGEVYASLEESPSTSLTKSIIPVVSILVIVIIFGVIGSAFWWWKTKHSGAPGGSINNLNEATTSPQESVDTHPTAESPLLEEDNAVGGQTANDCATAPVNNPRGNVDIDQNVDGVHEEISTSDS